MSKRGISPLIATVLIIGFTVALAAVIMVWGQGFIKAMQESSEASAEENIICGSEVNVEADNARLAGNNDPDNPLKINVIVTNNAMEITGFKYRVTGIKGADSGDAETTLGTGAKKIVGIIFNPDSTGPVETIELMPKISIRGKQAVCSQISLEKDVETVNLPLNGDFELGSGIDADNWIMSGSAAWSSDKSLSGSSSVKFQGALGEATGQNVPVEENTRYVLYAWTYQEGEDDGNFYLDLSDIPEECSAGAPPVSGEWKFTGCVTDNLAAGTTDVFLRLVAQVESVTFFDDVNLLKVDSS